MNDAPFQESIQTKSGAIKTPWVTWFVRLAKTITKNELQSLPVYADNAAAIADGKTAGTVYRTAAGQVMVVY